MSNILIPDKDLSWYVPDNWSLEDAATVPCVYTLCYYALYIQGEIKKGDKVLIHCGTSGVGQAAIHLALHEDCEIFTTVGTPEKRKFIREMFPSIPDDHIGSSRNTTFEQMVLTQTKSYGVDIVLNSLPEEKLQASVRCLGQGGRFLEIGKCDLTSNNSIGMMIFLKEVSFHGIILENVFDINIEEKINLKNYLAEGLKNGTIKPLVRKIFERNEVEAAFRYMTAGQHMGKVILKICDEKQAGKVPILAQPQYYCDDNKSYLILGGLGGFGLELADWLILRGAKNLLLTSKTGIKTGYQRMRTDLWKSYGVNVLIITGADAANRKDCEFILKSAEKQGPVDAIFNLAVVRKDSICKNQTPESFEESFKAKVWSTKALDELSRKLCPRLRQFVVFSSVSCGRGNAGQTNHGMANSVMERICERRVADGLPGLAIQWGAIGDVGFVAELQDDNKELVISGTLQQKLSSCLEKLEDFLLQNRPVVSSMVMTEKHVDGNASVAETIANIIGVKDIKTTSEDILLTEFGMDSRMAVEIKQTLEHKFDIFLTAHDIHTLTFAKLAEICGKDEKREKTQAQIDEEKARILSKQLLIRVTNNEDMIPDICIELPTRKDLRKVEVFLLPGIDGCGHIFNPLASTIKPVATVLQYGTNNIGLAYGSIPEYADHLLPYVLPKAEKQRTFILIGYSYGSLVAIELARRLEKHGLNGQLVLINGAPDLMKAMIEQYLPSQTQEELQNNILLYIMNNLQPAASEKLFLDLDKCTTWEQKLDSFVSHLASDNILSVENQKALCTTLYSRILALQKYDALSLTQIRAPIILLKPMESFTHMDKEDYSLQKITRDKVKVHYIEGNHVTMLDNDKIIAAINGEPLIDPEEFKKLLSEDRPLNYEEQEA